MVRVTAYILKIFIKEEQQLLPTSGQNCVKYLQLFTCTLYQEVSSIMLFCIIKIQLAPVCVEFCIVGPALYSSGSFITCSTLIYILLSFFTNFQESFRQDSSCNF